MLPYACTRNGFGALRRRRLEYASWWAFLSQPLFLIVPPLLCACMSFLLPSGPVRGGHGAAAAASSSSFLGDSAGCVVGPWPRQRRQAEPTRCLGGGIVLSNPRGLRCIDASSRAATDVRGYESSPRLLLLLRQMRRSLLLRVVAQGVVACSPILCFGSSWNVVLLSE